MKLNRVPIDTEAQITTRPDALEHPAGAPASPPPVPSRRYLHVSTALDQAEGAASNTAEARAENTSKSDCEAAEPAAVAVPVEPGDHPVRRRRANILRRIGSSVMTVALLGVALLAGLAIWSDYVTTPWTRDGRVRVQVASVAPQVSGRIVELRVRDNQFVHRGDVLYVIDKFDFQRTLASARTQLRIKAADLQVKTVQAERRQHLSDLATTAEEQQQYAGNATQAEAAFEGAQQDVDQADVNLQRTEVRAPVDGFVTNLLMRVGDYAHAGTPDISVIDTASYWIDGYFEETKMAHVCVGDAADAQLMGYREPLRGQVETITRGISVSDAAPSTQGLPNVDPVYTWVRLAQRVPVRIKITHVPKGIPLVSGMTVTVSIREAVDRPRPGMVGRIAQLFDNSTMQPGDGCLTETDEGTASPMTVSDDRPPAALTPSQINPGLAVGMTGQPGTGR